MCGWLGSHKRLLVDDWQIELNVMLPCNKASMEYSRLSRECMNKISYITIIVLATLLASCYESKSSSEDEDEESNIPEIEMPVIKAPGAGILGGLSIDYEEYYSGYWRATECGGEGQAVIGINGTSVELNTRATFMNAVFGEINSLGQIVFSPRSVNEEFGEVRPLEISGNIDWDTQKGSITFEVACRTSEGHSISNISFGIEKGFSQPDPSAELHRIKNEVIGIASTKLACSETSECRLLNLSATENCNRDAIVYSKMEEFEEEKLFSLQNEFRNNERLAVGYYSSIVLCGMPFYASCNSNVCELTDDVSEVPAGIEPSS